MLNDYYYSIPRVCTHNWFIPTQYIICMLFLYDYSKLQVVLMFQCLISCYIHSSYYMMWMVLNTSTLHWCMDGESWVLNWGNSLWERWNISPLEHISHMYPMPAVTHNRFGIPWPYPIRMYTLLILYTYLMSADGMTHVLMLQA